MSQNNPCFRMTCGSRARSPRQLPGSLSTYVASLNVRVVYLPSLYLWHTLIMHGGEKDTCSQWYQVSIAVMAFHGCAAAPSRGANMGIRLGYQVANRYTEFFARCSGVSGLDVLRLLLKDFRALGKMRWSHGEMEGPPVQTPDLLARVVTAGMYFLLCHSLYQTLHNSYSRIRLAQ